MRRRVAVPMLTVLVMTAVACSSTDGGGDDEAGDPDPAASTPSERAPGATAEVEASSSTSTTSEPPETDDPGATDAAEPDAGTSTVAERASGAGTRGGSRTTAGDPSDELEESLAELGVGEGTGVVEIDGAEWTFAAEICDARTGFVATGLASGPNGEDGFVEIYVDAPVDLDGDGRPDESGSVTVAVGKTELLGESDPSQPLWLALLQTFGGVDEQGFTYRIDGSSISGQGEIREVRDASAPPDQSVPFSFAAECG